MPKIIIHSPEGTFDAVARASIVKDLTDFALDCEGLPKSPFMKSTVWTYFHACSADEVFMGEEQAHLGIISMQVFVITGGLDDETKRRFIEGGTAILGRHSRTVDRVPAYIVLHEIAEMNWGIFGQNADLAAMRASSHDAAAL